MSVNPDIHDKAYQFFIEEAAELLQIIEDGILELRRDRGANTVHAVMRAAHSIKGGAASVELESIKVISHRMETVFRALYDETVIIDDELEGLLLDGVDCLKDPLSEQIETGSHDPEAALAAANPALEALETYLGADALRQADNYIPSSSDLGIDMVTSIFEIDVEEGIAHLEAVAANPENFPVLGEIQAQAEVFIGFGELLELPGFGAIAQAMLDACHNNPADPIELLNLALEDLHRAKELVMGGDRDQGGTPSEALLALAGDGSGSSPASSAPETGLSAGDFADFGLSEADLANFDFGSGDFASGDFASGDFANADLSAFTPDPAESNGTAPETGGLEDGFTDAGMGDLDLAALTLEGDALLNLAEASDFAEASESPAPAADSDDTASFDLGENNFQSLIDESGDFDLSDAEEDEFATVAQATTTNLPVNLEELGVAELESHPADGAASDSLDAMAQLANLMAEPETSEAPAGEAAEMAVPDAELEDLWADLSDDLNPDLGNDSSDRPETNLDADLDAEMDAVEDSALDSAFEIVLDQASETGAVQEAPSLNHVDLAALFGDEAEVTPDPGEIDAPGEQDVTMALSIAEADAAFEAMVDAATADRSEAELDPSTSLDLSFEDEPPSAAFTAPEVPESSETPAAQSSPNLQAIFDLDLPDAEASDFESASEQDAVTTNSGEDDLDDLIDPWSSLGTEDSGTPELGDRDSAEASSPSESLEAFQYDDSDAADEPSREPSEGLEESTAAAVAEPTTAADPEWINEGTFVQGLDMETFIQTDESIAGEMIAEEVYPAEAPQLLDQPAPSDPESIPEAAAQAETALWEESPREGFSDAASAPLEAGTFIQNLDDGTFIQALDDGTFIQGITAEPSEAAILNQPPVREEAFDEGTYVQSLEAGTFIQGITDAAPTSATDSDELSSPADEDSWTAPASAEADETEESLIPELQAFIAQAAAESAQSKAKKGNAQVAESDPVEPTSTESELVGSERAEPGPEIAQAPEPQAGESLPDTDAIARSSNPPTQPSSDLAFEDKRDEELPSLETMFSVDPERLEAFANDSLASEFMATPEVEAIQAIRAVEPDQAEDSPEAEEALPDAIATPDEAHQLPPNPLTPTAVEVALAEHQAMEPAAPSTALSQAKAEDINQAVLAVEQMFGQLPTHNQLPTAQAGPNGKDPKASDPDSSKATKKKRQQGTKLSGISVRVDLSVLERMNNLVGELVLSRNSLSLQHEQLQTVVTQLDKRFTDFEGQLNGLRGISDQMLVEPAQRRAAEKQGTAPQVTPLSAPQQEGKGDGDSDGESGFLLDGFDVLEMDRYSALHGQLQEIFEQLMQLEEGVDDIGVLLEQSTQSLTQQRQRLGLLQNELMWARMLPLDNILGRFPRVLRDMARKHGKSVDLNLNGTSVLVDKGMLEKLHDPMLHLLRNAFDHGIELPDEREKQGKPERGEIQINAYYQGNQTVIEIKDDGQGINLERIAKRAVELEWLSREEIKSIPQQTLLDLIFEPGFSTAAKLSELSGRGVGLDVVREQIKGLKGSVTVDFKKGKGTTFILRLPLTLTVAKLMVCQVGTTAIALPSDGIEDLLIPQPEQLKMVGHKRLLHWRDDLIPIQSMTELLDYSCPTADIASLKAITAKSIPVPKDWALPLLIFSRGSQRCAMEVNRLLMEQELVIKPFSSAMTPPSYSYGCTILGDGRMIPVLDGTALLQQLSDNSMALAAGVDLSDSDLEGDSSEGIEATTTLAQAMQADTILVVDDSTAMRRTMALSLEKAGYRVLQAGDGQEALTQLRQSSAIKLVICDVEMPNMNGFEFLSQRRREPVLMKTPVVMLTSRSSDKHRRLAMQLKAHDYFSKPYVEQDFLKSIKQILTSQAAAKV